MCLSLRGKKLKTCWSEIDVTGRNMYYGEPTQAADNAASEQFTTQYGRQ